jgi:predicted DNA-binding transcriptional regulator AlpA
MSTSTPPDTPAANIPGRQLIDAEIVGRKIGCSARHCYRMADQGLMPWGLKLGALRRWDAQEIDEWIGRGCPRVRN